jgi:hypothetical protein
MLPPAFPYRVARWHSEKVRVRLSRDVRSDNVAPLCTGNSQCTLPADNVFHRLAAEARGQCYLSNGRIIILDSITARPAFPQSALSRNVRCLAAALARSGYSRDRQHRGDMDDPRSRYRARLSQCGSHRRYDSLRSPVADRACALTRAHPEQNSNERSRNRSDSYASHYSRSPLHIGFVFGRYCGSPNCCSSNRRFQSGESATDHRR